MTQEDPSNAMERVIRSDGRYPPEAYSLLHEGLSKAVQEIYGDDAQTTGRRHVSGRQLCLAIREMAIERWGLLAKTVLARWNIHSTLDFGNMVYLLIEHDFMRKTEEDSIDDFRDVYDFDKAFGGHDDFELKE
ncbi:MAG TPA: Minf_1886 family protein [Phycisphaerae bacterium]|nr:Minf_1886 family protein [Phycisphaerae bacterium]